MAIPRGTGFFGDDETLLELDDVATFAANIEEAGGINWFNVTPEARLVNGCTINCMPSHYALESEKFISPPAVKVLSAEQSTKYDDALKKSFDDTCTQINLTNGTFENKRHIVVALRLIITQYLLVRDFVIETIKKSSGRPYARFAGIHMDDGSRKSYLGKLEGVIQQTILNIPQNKGSYCSELNHMLMLAIGMKISKIKPGNKHFGKVILSGDELYVAVNFEDPGDAARSRFLLSYVCDVGFNGSKDMTVEKLVQMGKILFDPLVPSKHKLKHFDKFRIRTMTIDPHKTLSGGEFRQCFDYELMKLNFLSEGSKQDKDQLSVVPCARTMRCINSFKKYTEDIDFDFIESEDRRHLMARMAAVSRAQTTTMFNRIVSNNLWGINCIDVDQLHHTAAPVPVIKMPSKKKTEIRLKPKQIEAAAAYASATAAAAKISDASAIAVAYVASKASSRDSAASLPTLVSTDASKPRPVESAASIPTLVSTDASKPRPVESAASIDASNPRPVAASASIPKLALTDASTHRFVSTDASTHRLVESDASKSRLVESGASKSRLVSTDASKHVSTIAWKSRPVSFAASIVVSDSTDASLRVPGATNASKLRSVDAASTSKHQTASKAQPVVSVSKNVETASSSVNDRKRPPPLAAALAACKAIPGNSDTDTDFAVNESESSDDDADYTSPKIRKRRKTKPAKEPTKTAASALAQTEPTKTSASVLLQSGTIPSMPPQDQDEHAVRRWREEMATFRANTLLTAQRNAQIFVSGVETHCRNTIAAAMERVSAAEAATIKIKTDAALHEKSSNACIERLKADVQSRISDKVSSGLELRRLLTAESVRAAAAETMVQALRERVKELEDAEILSRPLLLSSANRDPPEHLSFSLGLSDDLDIFDGVAALDFDLNPIESVAPPPSVEIARPTVEWMDAETKSMQAAMHGRGTLIRAIVTAVGDPKLKSDVDALMANTVEMPPSFDALVDMLRPIRIHS